MVRAEFLLAQTQRLLKIRQGLGVAALFFEGIALVIGLHQFRGLRGRRVGLEGQ